LRWLTVQRIPSLVMWPHALEQNITAADVCGRGGCHSGGQEAEKREYSKRPRQDTAPKDMAPSDLLPPRPTSCLHHLPIRPPYYECIKGLTR
jgi:hypothetical protein